MPIKTNVTTCALSECNIGDLISITLGQIGYFGIVGKSFEEHTNVLILGKAEGDALHSMHDAIPWQRVTHISNRPFIECYVDKISASPKDAASAQVLGGDIFLRAHKQNMWGSRLYNLATGEPFGGEPHYLLSFPTWSLWVSEDDYRSGRGKPVFSQGLGASAP